VKPSDIRHPFSQRPEDAPRPALLPDSSRFIRPATPGRPSLRRVTALQVRAWTVANMSYHVPDGSAYRALAADLYAQDAHERMAGLFAGLDAQNLVIDAQLRDSRARAQKLAPSSECRAADEPVDGNGAPSALIRRHRRSHRVTRSARHASGGHGRSGSRTRTHQRTKRIC
jgi:hypothetical protein